MPRPGFRENWPDPADDCGGAQMQRAVSLCKTGPPKRRNGLQSGDTVGPWSNAGIGPHSRFARTALYTAVSQEAVGTSHRKALATPLNPGQHTPAIVKAPYEPPEWRPSEWKESITTELPESYGYSIELSCAAAGNAGSTQANDRYHHRGQLTVDSRQRACWYTLITRPTKTPRPRRNPLSQCDPILVLERLHRKIGA